MKHAERLRSLGGHALETSAAEARQVSASELADWGDSQGARQCLLRTSLALIKNDEVLSRQFPWALAFPEWELKRPRRRNTFRGPYAIACVD